MTSRFPCTLLLVFVVFFTMPAYSQTGVDSIQKLKEVMVRAYLSEQPILRLPSSVSVLDNRQLKSQPGTSLLPALNTVPGLRMEERSPGSYRLSIRGSLLRSPFGVRNIKVYMDEFPLTDAGGNTYLNSIDAESVNSMEILKGPDGSLFGANSGGVILINPAKASTDTSGIFAGLKGGSYNFFHENIILQNRSAKHFFQLNQAYQYSDGYRENSRLNRQYGQFRYNWNYSEGNQLRLLAFYSVLDYKTPGGLTMLQYNNDPRSARPSTAVSAGALEQHAGVMNKTIYGGLLNESRILKQLNHTIAVFGSHTDFKNPFITNFEVRNENTAGIRTFMELKGLPANNFTWKVNAGLEWQQTRAQIDNYDNNRGEKGILQVSDDLTTRQSFFFTRASGTLFNRIDLEAAASINYYRFDLNKNNQEGIPDFRKFKPQLMPRIAFSYQLAENIAWRSTVSRGYSPPTLAEIRASNQEINTSLQPESGWNFETGIRLRNHNDRFWLDASVFHYKLRDAIVRRVNADDSEFYLNAGGTKQIGFESQFSYWVISPVQQGLIRGLQFRNSWTLNNFKFKNYLNGSTDFSGSRLTGVPKQVLVSSADVSLPASMGLFIQHNFTAKIPLNDLNSEYANSYNLLQLKLRWHSPVKIKPAAELFLGADNLLNEKYSLGNDLNAFGGRYYNAAPLRNYFIGLKASF
jgi:iron complex outermembrane receptor protein